jgi:putative peptidoglycan lipid II flippase
VRSLRRVTTPGSRTPSAPPPGVGGAGRVGAGIFLSRVAGFVRDAVLAGYLGSRREADIWYLGLRTPNIIQNLLGEGTLSASFIPVYARFVEEGREGDAGRFAGAALGLVAALAFGIALVGILLAPILVPVVYPRLDPTSSALLVTVIRILLPMTATLAVSAWALGILNTHRHFFLSYVAPVAWNVAIVGAAVTAGTVLGFSAAGRDADLVVAVAWGGLAGGFLQLAVMLPGLRPYLGDVQVSLGARVAGVREAIRSFLPVVASRGVVNLSALVDSILAALLVEGAVASLGRAQTLYLLPISLFGMAVAASELPELSRKGGAGAEVLAERVRGALGRVTGLLVPSAVAYLVFGDLLVEALFRRGAFGAPDTRVVGAVLGAYALGLVASGSSRTLTSAFYALRDADTPARVAVLRVVISLGLGAALMVPLDRLAVGPLRLGAMGLALGSAVGAWVEYVLLRRALGRALGPHGPGAGPVARIAAAAGAGALVAAALRLVAEEGVRASLVPALAGPVMAIGTAGGFGVVYLLVARSLGVGISLPGFIRRRS